MPPTDKKIIQPLNTDFGKVAAAMVTQAPKKMLEPVRRSHKEMLQDICKTPITLYGDQYVRLDSIDCDEASLLDLLRVVSPHLILSEEEMKSGPAFPQGSGDSTGTLISYDAVGQIERAHTRLSLESVQDAIRKLE